LGIGTASPRGLLDVSSGGVSGVTSYIYHQGNANAAYPSITGSPTFALGWNFTGGTGEVDFFNCSTSPQGGFRFYQMTSASAATQLISISGTGYVGIGTASPSALLDVRPVSTNPSLTADTEGFYLGFSSSVGLAFGSYPSGSYAAWIQTKRTSNGGNADPLAINPLGGNVGIGIGSAVPASVLHLLGPANNTGGITLGNDTTNVYYIYRDGSTGFLFLNGFQSSFSGYKFSVNNGSAVMILNNDLSVTIAGVLIASNMPLSNPGAGTKKLWADPADGYRVKFAN